MCPPNSITEDVLNPRGTPPADIKPRGSIREIPSGVNTGDFFCSSLKS